MQKVLSLKVFMPIEEYRLIIFNKKYDNCLQMRRFERKKSKKTEEKDSTRKWVHVIKCAVQLRDDKYQWKDSNKIFQKLEASKWERIYWLLQLMWSHQVRAKKKYNFKSGLAGCFTSSTDTAATEIEKVKVSSRKRRVALCGERMKVKMFRCWCFAWRENVYVCRSSFS